MKIYHLYLVYKILKKFHLNINSNSINYQFSSNLYKLNKKMIQNEFIL